MHSHLASFEDVCHVNLVVAVPCTALEHTSNRICPEVVATTNKTNVEVSAIANWSFSRPQPYEQPSYVPGDFIYSLVHLKISTLPLSKSRKHLTYTISYLTCPITINMPLDWESQKGRIRGLYITNNMQLSDVIKEMKTRYGFDARYGSIFSKKEMNISHIRVMRLGVNVWIL